MGQARPPFKELAMRLSAGGGGAVHCPPISLVRFHQLPCRRQDERTQTKKHCGRALCQCFPFLLSVLLHDAFTKMHYQLIQQTAALKCSVILMFQDSRSYGPSFHSIV